MTTPTNRTTNTKAGIAIATAAASAKYGLNGVRNLHYANYN